MEYYSILECTVHVTYPPAPELTAGHYPVLLLLQELSEVVIALTEQCWVLNTTTGDV